MSKVHICSAHFGGEPINTLPTLSSRRHHLTQAFYHDGNTPARQLSMHPRLKGKIPKMLESAAHEADWYIWIDSKLIVRSSDLASDVLDAAGGAPMVLYDHPWRSSISDEAALVADHMRAGDRYLLERYSGEPIEEQVAHYLADPDFVDDKIFSMGFFAYHRSCADMMRAWFVENCIWTIQDQISMPYVIAKWRMPFARFESGTIYDNRFVQHRRFYKRATRG